MAVEDRREPLLVGQRREEHTELHRTVQQGPDVEVAQPPLAVGGRHIRIGHFHLGVLGAPEDREVDRVERAGEVGPLHVAAEIEDRPYAQAGERVDVGVGELVQASAR